MSSGLRAGPTDALNGEEVEGNGLSLKGVIKGTAGCGDTLGRYL